MPVLDVRDASPLACRNSQYEYGHLVLTNPACFCNISQPYNELGRSYRATVLFVVIRSDNATKHESSSSAT